MKKWLKRIALGLLGTVATLLLAGVVYEFISRIQARNDYPPPGTMVDIGGRSMQLDCRGNGGPVVVFESGLDEKGSMSWEPVHNQVAQFTRACAYSRAGVMWSDPGGAFTPESVAQDLHVTLRAAGEAGPFVLVGHSLGGPYSMIYTRLFPTDVAGLVFVDTSHPDQMERLKPVMSLTPADQIPVMRAMDYLSWTGITRLLSGMSQGEVPNQPAVVAEAGTAWMPYSISAVGAELENLEATLSAGGELRTLGDRPLYVLTAAAPLPQAMRDMLSMTPAQEEEFHVLWTELQADEAAWSSNSRHVQVPEAMHYIQFDAPDKVVAGVAWVVEQVRAGQQAR